MQVNSEQLLAIIGRLHVENAVLSGQLEAMRAHQCPNPQDHVKETPSEEGDDRQ